MFAEKISHHLLVSSFYAEGCGYKVHGQFNLLGSAGLNSVTVTNSGNRVLSSVTDIS
jgi:hypothetical protein